MSVKALKKQFAAAVAMVVVAGVAFSSSTYAWFVNNNKVSATGMSVNATADSSLLIKGMNGDDFGSVGTTSISQLQMKPATSSDGLNFAHLGDQVVVESKTSSTATWSNSGAFQDGDLVGVTAAEAATYYGKADYKIKSIGTAADIYVSDVDVSDKEKIFKSTRVSVTVTDSSGNAITKVYNPQGTANTADQVGGISATKWILVSDTDIYTDVTNAQIWNLAADTEYDVSIRVWFEGQDVNCYTDNIKTTGTGITVDFSKYEAP